MSRTRTGRAGELWPVLLLLVVVAVPTIGVLWFVGIAMENQQLATQQRLTDAYRVHLETVQRQIDDDWQRLLEQADALGNADGELTQEVFAEAVKLGIGDSFVLYDQAGEIQYPNSFSASTFQQIGPRWEEARRLENELSDPLAAHEIYSQISNEASTDRECIRAIQAQLRCLLKAGEKTSAKELVVQSLDNTFDTLEDSRSRSIAANIQLMAIERLEPSADIDRILDSLLQSVHDYNEHSLSTPQRLFLMKQLMKISPDRIDQRLLTAEDIAGQFVAAHPRPSRDQVVRESQIPGVWQVRTPSGRMVILLQEKSLYAKTLQSATRTTLPGGADIHVMRPGEEPRAPTLLSMSAGPSLPGWRLGLSLQDSREIDATAMERNKLYLWTGILVVLFTSVLALFIARAFRRQIRLANLKNDLVGTVSHELKTPLSSMRLLVDTLLEEDQFDQQTTRDYLQLIAKENTRLSRLIDNFLTFTRMEQNRHVFDFRRIEPLEIVNSAVESAGGRFHCEDCTLTVTVDEDLPSIHGDKGSLVTVLLNLLDNAYKYSDAHREITLIAHAANGGVCFSVSDNGIGLSRTAIRRVFQRFFQVDQSLARDGGGCGLGLSIVESIVKAHRGKVSITSSVGKGSTLTVTLPVMSDPPSHGTEVIE